MPITLQRGLLRPSYKQGFARGPSESDRPERWQNLRGLWLPFLGPTGITLRDVSGYGNHGTLTNMVPATDWVIDGEVGSYALNFPGSDDLISVPDNAVLTPTNVMSISIRLKQTADYSQFDGILGKTNPGIWSDGYGMYFDSTTIRFWADQWNSNEGAVTFSASDRDWHTITGVYDKTNVTVYLDGVAGSTVGSFTSDIAASTDPLQFAKLSGGAGEFASAITIAYVALYNVALPLRAVREEVEDPFGIVRLKQRMVGLLGAADFGTFAARSGRRTQMGRGMGRGR